jgi:hypothetical protein
MRAIVSLIVTVYAAWMAPLIHLFHRPDRDQPTAHEPERLAIVVASPGDMQESGHGAGRRSVVARDAVTVWESNQHVEAVLTN